MKFIHENIDELYKTEEGMLQIIRALCEGYKSRVTNNLLWVSTTKTSTFKTHKDLADFADPILPLKDLFPNQSYQSALQQFETLGYSCPPWLQELLIRCNDLKWEREGQSFYTPYIYSLDQGPTEFSTYGIQSPAGSDDTYDDLFLLNGIDMHTRAGKVAFNSFKKKGCFENVMQMLPERFQSNEGFDLLIWYMNSALFTNYRISDSYPDFELMFRNEMITPQVEQAYEEVLPAFNGLRRWVIEKMSGDFVRCCQSVRLETS